MENWSGVAAAYRASFATLCAGAISKVLTGLVPGRLLDVGCGTGELLAEVQRRGERCDGVDSDPDMLAVARQVAPGHVCQAMLPELPFADGSFENVVANFVVNHVPDPRRAVRELARVARPGGRVLATIWPAGGAEWRSLVTDVFTDAGVIPLPSNRLPEHLDFARSVEGLTDLFRQAGLNTIQAREIEWIWPITPERLWTGIEGGVASPGRTYAAQEASIRRVAKNAFFARTAVQAVDGALEFHCRATYALASR